MKFSDAEWWMEPLKIGVRVYVKPLDVYGKIVHTEPGKTIGAPRLYTIVCEAPLTDFRTQQTIDGIRVQVGD